MYFVLLHFSYKITSYLKYNTNIDTDSLSLQVNSEAELGVDVCKRWRAVK